LIFVMIDVWGMNPNVVMLGQLPSLHVFEGPTWGPYGQICGPHVVSPNGTHNILPLGSKWVLCGLLIGRFQKSFLWASGMGLKWALCGQLKAIFLPHLFFCPHSHSPFPIRSLSLPPLSFPPHVPIFMQLTLHSYGCQWCSFRPKC